MNEPITFSCGKCSAVWRERGETSCACKDPQKRMAAPANCPSRKHGQIMEDAFDLYAGQGPDSKMANVAARVEGLSYKQNPGSKTIRPGWTRVEDTIVFAKMMGYSKIGIASCIALLDETQRLSVILEAQGLTPVSVCCKTGGIDKRRLGLQESDKVRPGTFEAACNPVAQARLLNLAKTDMNIIMGLCVGHDMLFAKHSDASVTTLVVKDRVTGHNPVCVLYGQNFFYKRLRVQPIEVEEL